jgi:hypothetical protein
MLLYIHTWFPLLAIGLGGAICFTVTSCFVRQTSQRGEEY